MYYTAQSFYVCVMIVLPRDIVKRKGINTIDIKKTVPQMCKIGIFPYIYAFVLHLNLPQHCPKAEDKVRYL